MKTAQEISQIIVDGFLDYPIISKSGLTNIPESNLLNPAKRFTAIRAMLDGVYKGMEARHKVFEYVSPAIGNPDHEGSIFKTHRGDLAELEVRQGTKGTWRIQVRLYAKVDF